MRAATLRLVLALLVVHSAYAKDMPNIVIVLADDLGWGDVGYHNAEISTPNIDRIASEGMELDRFYVNPTCSPTRASLLSGQFATTHGVDSPIQWHSVAGLPLDIKIMPEYLQEAGYKTHLVGKWHLGAIDRNYWPQRRGFDSFYGHLSGAIGYYDKVFTGGVDWQRDGTTVFEAGYATDLIAEEAVRLIEASSKQNPFFLYVAFNAPHTPLEAPGGQRDGHKQRETYLQMVQSLDHGIGQIVKSLEQQGLSENTLLIFMSDNGAAEPNPWLIELLLPPARDGHGDNMFLRDSKGRVWEGGIRVPAVVWWPGKIQSDAPNEQPMHIADILPTIADVVGIPLPELDGESQKTPWLLNTIQPRLPFIVANLGSEALVDWPWKIVREVSLPVIPDFFKTENWYLFDLAKDPGEQDDLAEQHPQRLNSLREKLLSYTRRQAIEMVTDKDWDEFGGKVTREPWAEGAIN